MAKNFTRRDLIKSTGMAAALPGLSSLRRWYNEIPEMPDNALPWGPDMNVILIFIDSLRKDHVGAYGNDRIRTPNLNSLAEESLRFSRAHPESGHTIPARRAAHTGMRSFPFRGYETSKGEHVHVYGWQPIPDDQPTVSEILRERGYQTMMVSDNPHFPKAPYNFQRGFEAFDFIRGQERDYYKPAALCPKEKLEGALLKQRREVESRLRQYFANTSGIRSEEGHFPARVFGRAAEFLEGADKDSPFFLAVDCFEPHEPWDPPQSYIELYSDGYEGPEPHDPAYGPADYLTEGELERMRTLYAASVTMTDRWLGTLLERVEDLDLGQDTILILLSDHGICLGEHGIVGKPPSALYPEVTDIPFMVRHPKGKLAGEISGYHASTHDIAPTILGAVGIDQPRPMDGQDLSVLFDGGEPEERPYVTMGVHDHVWARDEDYAMLSRNDGSEAGLYDLAIDPEQLDDIARDNEDIVERMFDEYIVADAGGELPDYDT